MQVNHNKHLSARVAALFANLDAAYAAGSSMSSASKGVERELFVTHLLEQVFPLHYRFSSGDITDSYNYKSGQVDVVLEHAHGFSFPVLTVGPRMYLAESVAAVIEVKSDIASQWDEVATTATKVKHLKRRYLAQLLEESIAAYESGTLGMSAELLASHKRALAAPGHLKGEVEIPFYAVGFQGWKKQSTVKEKIANSDVDGIFIIAEKLFSGPTCSEEGLNSLLAFLNAIGQDFNKESDRFTPLVSYYLK